MMTEQIKKLPVLTRRMKWIIGKMKEHGAIIQEYRDAFLEKSRWGLQWETDDPSKMSGAQGHEVEVTEKMRQKLLKAKLIKLIDRYPVYDKSGKFITSENVYGLAED